MNYCLMRKLPICSLVTMICYDEIVVQNQITKKLRRPQEPRRFFEKFIASLKAWILASQNVYIYIIVEEALWIIKITLIQHWENSKMPCASSKTTRFLERMILNPNSLERTQKVVSQSVVASLSSQRLSDGTANKEKSEKSYVLSKNRGKKYKWICILRSLSYFSRGNVRVEP